MLDVFHIAKPQNCDIQTFYGFAVQTPTNDDRGWRIWNKPRGVSHIYMLLIGGGGNGDGTSGGGSGSVTVWYGAAQNVPDSLRIYVRGSNPIAADTLVAYQSTSGPITLLRAASSSNANGGGGDPSTTFGASGFYRNTVGQNGASSSVSNSSTTFLSGGAGNNIASVTANYGYQTNVSGSNGAGYFQLQPIIVGVGNANNTSAVTGCGSGVNATVGGPGFALIASW